jgi:hypothetical protein
MYLFSFQQAPEPGEVMVVTVRWAEVTEHPLRKVGEVSRAEATVAAAEERWEVREQGIQKV